jgi:hypothetical protein
MWASSFITALWKYIKNLWGYRNQILHGATTEEVANILIAQLHTEVTNHYTQFSLNYSYVLPRHSYLFTQSPLATRLTLPYIHLQCWLRSVDEARHILITQEISLRSTSNNFSSLFRWNTPTQPGSDSITDSTYDPSSTHSSTTVSLVDTLPTQSVTAFSDTASLTDITVTDTSSNSSTIIYRFPTLMMTLALTIVHYYSLSLPKKSTQAQLFNPPSSKINKVSLEALVVYP